MNENLEQTAGRSGRPVDEQLHRSLAESAAEAARIARGVTPGRLAGPTPCAGFDTRTLVNHWVLYSSHGLAHRARREQLSDELQNRDFTAAADWADAYAAELDRAVAAWAEPAVWEGGIDSGGGVTPAPEVAAMLLAELVVHGWDVARATGQDYRCSPETALAVLGVVEANAELYRRYQGFGEPVEVPATASVLTRALALSGRDPHWAAV
ncbi:TIGR03086 family metal-binding protein [Kitasatospora sp. NBC_00315]|uniref:TIGR03086 family metal-binding protein n=1 Tax=Kitasatospora sp. NBC_00315 TaxID=2975963 RepID=UPI00324AD40C